VTVWNPQGTALQNALVQRALDACDFPFDRLLPSLAGEGKTTIGVTWADLSARSSNSGDSHASGGPEHDHSHAEGVHSIEREVEGRARVLGLFYLPPHTKVVLDTTLEANPELAAEVFLAEAAHAVDYHHMVPAKTMRRAVWNALHGSNDGGDIAESGDVEHGHSWFDGGGGYSSWVGESFMEGFVRAFAPTVPVTITLDHPVTPEATRAIRAALLSAPPPPASAVTARVYRAKPSSRVYHDAHQGIAAGEWFDTATLARAAGLRPCRSCKPPDA